MDQFKIGYRRTDDRSSTALEFDDKNEFKISKPTIVIFGGNPTTIESEAGRYARTVDNWLAGFGDINRSKFDIVSVVYANGSPLENNLFLAGSDYDYNELAETIFLPLIANEQKQKLDVNLALKNLSLVSFFGHSAGAYVMDNIMDKFLRYAIKLGYTDDEIFQMCRQIKFLTFAPYQMVDAPIKSIYITPSFDELNSFYKAIEFMATKDNVSTNNNIDLKKYMNMLNNHSPRFLKYGQKMADSVENDGIMTMFDNKDTLVVTPWKLSKNEQSDHGLVGIVRGPNNEISLFSTDIGIKISDFIEKILKEYLSNSISNLDKQVPEEININKLNKFCRKLFTVEKPKQKIN